LHEVRESAGHAGIRTTDPSQSAVVVLAPQQFEGVSGRKTMRFLPEFLAW